MTKNQEQPRATVLGFYLVEGEGEGKASYSLVIHWPKAASKKDCANQTIVGGGVKKGEGYIAAMMREVGEEYGADAMKKAEFIPLQSNPAEFVYRGSCGTLKCCIPFLIIAEKDGVISQGKEVVSHGQVSLHGEGFENVLRICMSPAKALIVRRMRDLVADQHPQYLSGSYVKAA